MYCAIKSTTPAVRFLVFSSTRRFCYSREIASVQFRTCIFRLPIKPFAGKQQTIFCAPTQFSAQIARMMMQKSKTRLEVIRFWKITSLSAAFLAHVLLVQKVALSQSPWKVGQCLASGHQWLLKYNAHSLTLNRSCTERRLGAKGARVPTVYN